MTQDQLIAAIANHMQRYGGDYETARRDVLDEYGQPETNVDARGEKDPVTGVAHVYNGARTA